VNCLNDRQLRPHSGLATRPADAHVWVVRLASASRLFQKGQLIRCGSRQRHRICLSSGGLRRGGAWCCGLPFVGYHLYLVRGASP
jgi:hypothetical protein